MVGFSSSSFGDRGVSVLWLFGFLDIRVESLLASKGQHWLPSPSYPLQGVAAMFPPLAQGAGGAQSSGFSRRVWPELPQNGPFSARM